MLQPLSCKRCLGGAATTFTLTFRGQIFYAGKSYRSIFQQTKSSQLFHLGGIGDDSTKLFITNTEKVFNLRRLKNILYHSSLSNVYRALIESHIQYVDVIWGSLSNSKLESLQRLQDRAASTIQTSRKKDNWTSKFLAVEQLIAFNRAVMVYKTFTKLYPEYLWNTYHLRSYYSRYNTRFCRNIQIPKYNLEYAKKGISYSASKLGIKSP